MRATPERVVVETGGVGYDLHVSLVTFSELDRAGVGAEVALHVHTHVREDQLALFGFATERERDLFERLIGVSGIGPRLAQVVLSGMAPDDLVAALAAGDVARLVRIPGVAGRRVTAPVETIDLMPTVFEAMGLTPPYPFGGTSLLVDRPSGEASDRVRIAETHDAVAVQNAAWKGIFPRSRRQPASLFRIAEDPEESSDLAAEHPEVLAQLWASYAAMREAGRETASKFVLASGEQAPLDDKLKDELRALGYVQ